MCKITKMLLAVVCLEKEDCIKVELEFCNHAVLKQLSLSTCSAIVLPLTSTFQDVYVPEQEQTLTTADMWAELDRLELEERQEVRKSINCLISS